MSTTAECRNGHDLSVLGRTKDGRCKTCCNAKDRRYYAANLESQRERGRRYRAAHPEISRENMRRWRAANPETYREQSRRHQGTYRVTVRGQLTKARYQTRQNIKVLDQRIAEIERELQYGNA